MSACQRAAGLRRPTRGMDPEGFGSDLRPKVDERRHTQANRWGVGLRRTFPHSFDITVDLRGAGVERHRRRRVSHGVTALTLPRTETAQCHCHRTTMADRGAWRTGTRRRERPDGIRHLRHICPGRPITTLAWTCSRESAHATSRELCRQGWHNCFRLATTPPGDTLLDSRPLCAGLRCELPAA